MRSVAPSGEFTHHNGRVGHEHSRFECWCLLSVLGRSGESKSAPVSDGCTDARKVERKENEGPELSPTDATTFRALAAIANYLAQDRADIAFCAKELCREFAIPTVHSWDRLVRLCKYLYGVPRLVHSYPFQSPPKHLTCYVDTDFAGCKSTRRSTSVGVIMHGSQCIKHWATTQTTIPLSQAQRLKCMVLQKERHNL